MTNFAHFNYFKIIQTDHFPSIRKSHIKITSEPLSKRQCTALCRMIMLTRLLTRHCTLRLRSALGMEYADSPYAIGLRDSGFPLRKPLMTQLLQLTFLGRFWKMLTWILWNTALIQISQAFLWENITKLLAIPRCAAGGQGLTGSSRSYPLPQQTVV